MRTLLFVPAHPEYGMRGLTAAAISAMNHPAGDTIIRSNKRAQYDENPLTNSRMAVLDQYQWARDKALAEGYDYLLTVEADMVPPPDLLGRLLACQADIAYSLYIFRRSRKWSAYTEFQPGWGKSLSESECLSVAWGAQLEVAGQGLGATLLNRKTLETVPFRGIHGTHCDGWLAIDAQMAGLVQVCDTGCLSGHVDGAVVLWPDVEAPELVREEPNACLT